MARGQPVSAFVPGGGSPPAVLAGGAAWVVVFGGCAAPPCAGGFCCAAGCPCAAANRPCGTASASERSHATHGEPDGMRRMMPLLSSRHADGERLRVGALDLVAGLVAFEVLRVLDLERHLVAVRGADGH